MKRSKRVSIDLATMFPAEARDLLTARGVDVLNRMGDAAVRDVLRDLFSGHNLRDSTEMLTRRRTTAISHAIVKLFLDGHSQDEQFVAALPEIAVAALQRRGTSREARSLSQWVLGLTEKASQNVLRDDPTLLGRYKERYVEACNVLAAEAEKSYGRLQGKLSVGRADASADWLFFTYLLNTVGMQTLAIRGSEKSQYGKLFEKLALGSLLTILGFHYSPTVRAKAGTFWLSSRHEKRESDATLIYKQGQGVRFDIGFIGRGNSEITLDKVSRFERVAAFGQNEFYMATIIIIDRVGRASRVERLASNIDGNIVQMSASYWVKDVARVLKERLPGFDHPVLRINDADMDEYLKKELAKIPVRQFAIADNEAGEEEGEEDEE